MVRRPSCFICIRSKGKSAKTGTDSYFKSIAKKLANFFKQVNAMLGGRLEQTKYLKNTWTVLLLRIETTAKQLSLTLMVKSSVWRNKLASEK